MSVISGKASRVYRLKRIYEPPAPEDGLRVLVDRLWPRGMSKAAARIDHWLRDLSPSDDLRRTFHGDLDRWAEFTAAYARELEAPAARAAIQTLRGADAAVVTLLFAAKDERRNNAAALLEWLQAAG